MNMIELKHSLFYCVEMLLAVFIYMIPLQKRSKFGLRIVGSALALGICMLLNVVLFHAGVQWFVFVFLVMAVICYACCDISLTEAVYCSSTGYLTQHIASACFILFVSKGATPMSGESIVYYAIYAGVYIFSYYVFARKLPEDKHFLFSQGNVIISASVTLGIVLALSMVTKRIADPQNMGVNNTTSLQLFWICQFMEITLCILVLTLQLLQKKEMDRQREILKREEIWNRRQAQYELSKDNIDLINRKCHDLKHQIAALVDTDDSRKREFAKEIQDMIEFYDVNIDTGNEILNTILMERGLYCKMHEIQWTCVADGKNLAALDDLDLYTLFGNAFDNAVESVEKIENPDRRVIMARVWRKESFLMIQVENSFEGEILMKNGLPVTSKKDNQNHGFGIKSIRSIAEKYHGGITVQTEGNTFLLTVMIPVNE